MHALTTHAQHRGDDRAGDAPLSRVHHDRTPNARRTGDGHAPHGAALRTCRAWPPHSIALDTDARKAPARLVLVDGSRARVATSAISRGGTAPLHAGRSGARRTEHAAALAVEPRSDRRIEISRSQRHSSERTQRARFSAAGPTLGGTP